MAASPVPAARIRTLNTRPVNAAGDFVLYWMTSARRIGCEFRPAARGRALPGARQAARRARGAALRLPLRPATASTSSCSKAWPANARDLASSRARYFPYVERSRGEGRGLIRTLAHSACAIVTDWYPASFLPHMTFAAAAQAAVSLEAVDSNGLIPLSTHGQAFPVARSYRAFVQRTLREHLRSMPDESPLDRLRAGAAPRPPPGRRRRALAGGPGGAARRRSRPTRGAADRSCHRARSRWPADRGAARERLAAFIETGLRRYADDHNHPDLACSSQLSPYLHFGHISAHEVFAAVATHERWTTRRLGGRSGGKREGWWGMSPSARGIPRSTRRLARARLQHVRVRSQLPHMAIAARVGTGNPGSARRRPAAPPLLAAAAGRGADG